MSGPKRLAKSALHSALGMQLGKTPTEEPCHPQRRAGASAIRASCVPFALVHNIVNLKTAST
jgi:hypothetical protein